MGVAVLINNADFSGKNLGQVTVASANVTGLVIQCNNSYSAPTVQLAVKYKPFYTSQKGVTWSVTSGSTYATINSSSGLLTILSGADGDSVTVRATSTYNAQVYAEKTITVTYVAEPIYATDLTISLGTQSNNTIQASVAYTPNTTNQLGVTWAITSGGTYATINEATGLITVQEGASDAAIEITATYSHGSTTLTKTATTTVTYTGVVLPQDLQDVWDANVTSMSSLSGGGSNWRWGSEEKTKAAYLKHYNALGGSVPAVESVKVGTSNVTLFGESGTASTKTGAGTNYTSYDSTLEEYLYATSVAAFVLGSKSNHNRLLVVSNYQAPDSSSYIIAGGCFGNTNCTQVTLKETMIDFAFAKYVSGNTNGLKLNSSDWGKSVVEFKKLYVEFNSDGGKFNAGTTDAQTGDYNGDGFVAKVMIDTGDGNGYVDYTSKLVAGGVAGSQTSGLTPSGAIRPQGCPMYINVGYYNSSSNS